MASLNDDAKTEVLDPLLLRARSRVGITLLGKWRLDVLLGVGGMAAVYAATHRNGSRAAVKLLYPELSLDPEIRNRFLREGYVANSVGHEGAVKVLDDETTEDGSIFLVTELLDGETLEDRRLASVADSRRTRSFASPISSSTCSYRRMRKASFTAI